MRSNVFVKQKIETALIEYNCDKWENCREGSPKCCLSQFVINETIPVQTFVQSNSRWLAGLSLLSLSDNSFFQFQKVLFAHVLFVVGQILLNECNKFSAYIAENSKWLLIVLATDHLDFSKVIEEYNLFIDRKSLPIFVVSQIKWKSPFTNQWSRTAYKWHCI